MFEHLSHFWESAEPYLYQLLIGSIAILALLKDWRDYGEASGEHRTLVRVSVLLVTAAVILLSLVETHNSRRDAWLNEQAAAQRDIRNQSTIKDLTDQVRQEREENRSNSEGFRKSFAALYDKYSELASRVRNADLLNEIKRTREELRATQEKLNQPKAKLTASFWNSDSSLLPVHETTVSRKSDGSVSLDLIVMNQGDPTAHKGGCTVRICVSCKYASEPQGFKHVSGSEEWDRQFEFEDIFARSIDQKRTIEVLPPPGVNRFEIDIICACETCIVGGKETLWVNVR